MKKIVSSLLVVITLLIAGFSFLNIAYAAVPTFTANRTALNTIVLTFSENVTGTAILNSFTVVGASAVTNTVVTAGTSVTLTTTGLTATNGTPNVGYVAGTGDIISVSTSDEIADGGAIAAADYVAPTFTAHRTAINTIVLTFSENVTGTAILNSFTAVGASAVTNTAPTATTTVTLTTTGLTATSGTVNVGYVAGTGDILDNSAQTNEVAGTMAQINEVAVTPLLGIAGMTLMHEGSWDDTSQHVELPFSFPYYGVNRTVFIGSNSYLTFGAGSNRYSGLSCTNPGMALHIGSADNSWQRWYRQDNGNGSVRVRFEGNNATNGTVGSPTIVWEATLYDDGKIEVDVGAHSRTGGLANISNGSADASCVSYTLAENKNYVFTTTGTFYEAADYVAPTFTAARTAINTIVLTFSENVTGTAIAGSFTVEGATSAVTNTAPTESTTITLTTTGLTRTSGTVNVGYVAGTGDILDNSAQTNEVANGGAIVATDFPFNGGTGELEDPYQVINCLQLQNMNLYLDADYILNNDIDCSATSISDTEDPDYNESLYNDGTGFDPIGSVDDEEPTYYSFEGVLDGQDYKITNLYINRTDDAYFGDGYYIGLFSTIAGGAEVKNLGIEDADITGYEYVGALAGGLSGTVTNVYSTGVVEGDNRVGGLTGENGGTIVNSYATGNLNGREDVGGLSGRNDGTIENSYATGDVIGTASGIGGLVGRNSGGDITNSYATGNVEGDNRVGGLTGANGGTIVNSYATGNLNGIYDVGGLSGRSGGTIENSYATGDVIGTDSGIGGLVGRNTGGDITNSYATGNVEGNNRVGGFTGANGGTIQDSYATGSVTGIDQVGGFSGRSGGSIFRSYSVGLVIGTTNVGGFLGRLEGGDFSNTFWDIETSGQAESAAGTGTTTVEMQTEDTFTDASWDFEEIWTINTLVNDSYPYFQWQDPILTEITPVSSPTTDNTPNYTFNSTEAGIISYGGSCSSADTTAEAGDNTITFNTLADGTYANCTITVTDDFDNASNPLAVTSFTVKTASNTSSESRASSSSGPPGCGDSKPSSTPNLFQIDAGDSEVTLYISPVTGANKYAVTFGYTPGEERFGTEFSYSDTGGVIPINISHLNPNTTYYFKVRGGNGCMPGDWSNEMKIKTQTKGSRQTHQFFKGFLSRFTTLLSKKNKTVTVSPNNALNNQSDMPTACQYIVKSGDSLWSIATSQLGDGSKYPQIIQQNNLVSTTLLDIGQILKIDCNLSQQVQTIQTASPKPTVTSSPATPKQSSKRCFWFICW